MRRIFVSLRFAAALAAYFFAVSTTAAHAYLDAGTGSMILQVLLGGAAGLAMVGKLYWHRMLVLLRIRPELPMTGDTEAVTAARPEHRADR